jgi:hypothetical protein
MQCARWHAYVDQQALTSPQPDCHPRCDASLQLSSSALSVQQMYFPTRESLRERAYSTTTNESPRAQSLLHPPSAAPLSLHSDKLVSRPDSASNILPMQHEHWVQACNASVSRSSSVSRQALSARYGVAVSCCELPVCANVANLSFIRKSRSVFAVAV